MRDRISGVRASSINTLSASSTMPEIQATQHQVGLLGAAAGQTFELTGMQAACLRMPAMATPSRR